MPAGHCCRWPCTTLPPARHQCGTSPNELESRSRTKRGVGGGYVLARPAAEIRISEILSAVDGPISIGDFGDPHQDGSCDHEGQCVLLAIWKSAGEHMRVLLEGFTLQAVADAANGSGAWPDATQFAATKR